ncbi:MAG: hypothetical protein H7Z14_17130 [Anaerolineae bacterium]|nr:hypothetical protein [Phycisphaerae bacterium]
MASLRSIRSSFRTTPPFILPPSPGPANDCAAAQHLALLGSPPDFRELKTEQEAPVKLRELDRARRRCVSERPHRDRRAYRVAARSFYLKTPTKAAKIHDRCGQQTGPGPITDGAEICANGMVESNPERKVEMFEQVTKIARIAVAIANQETHRLGGKIIGDAELLLGLTKEPRGLCHLALSRMGVDLHELRRDLENQPRSLDAGTAPTKLPQTRDFKVAIQEAIEIARELGHKHVGTEHMLLALLRNPDFASARVLARQEVSFERASAMILTISGEANYKVEE